MITFRTASRGDVDRMISWAADEGWNPGIDDAAAFHATDSAGFFVAMDGTQLVAGISVVRHSDAFAFLGLYIVHPSHRGRGVGIGLWTHAIAHAGQRTIGLDGVPAQQGNYRKSGFVPAGQTRRFTGKIAARHSDGVRPIRPEDVSALIEIEARCSGWRKARYLSTWLQDAPTRHTLVAQDHGTYTGFVTARQCRLGAKLGPFWAASPEVAVTLLHSAAERVGDTLILDVPDRSDRLDTLCRDLGFVESFQTARMYAGPFSQPEPSLFGVTTLELG